jgi:hypothetical protein
MDEKRREEIRADWSKEQSAENRKRARQSCSSAGWLLDWLNWSLTLGALTMAAAPLVARLPEEIGNALVINGWSKAVPLYAGFIAVPLLIIPRALVASAVAGEKKWLEGLPFAVDHFESYLGMYPRLRALKLVIEFKGQAPDVAQLQAALAAKEVKWSVVGGGTGFELERDPGLGVYRGDLSRRLHGWFHRYVPKTLLPLHAKWPIERLTFVN